jgi:hypothetical protein
MDRFGGFAQGLTNAMNVIASRSSSPDSRDTLTYQIMRFSRIKFKIPHF